MGKYGIKIKNIKAGTLYGYNLGIRDRYDYTDAMLNNSLFSKYMSNNGMNVYKGESTRDIICLEFDFGSRSYEEEMKHMIQLKLNAKDDKEKNKIQEIIDKINLNKYKYVKKTNEENREDFYQNNVKVEYKTLDKKENTIKTEEIEYCMLYRTPSKAKVGQVMFINKKLYIKAYDWLTMGIGNKMPIDNAKIVEISAYAPLTTSTIIDTIYIPVENILILKDQDSLFNTMANIVAAEEYDIPKIVLDEKETQKNQDEAIKNNKINKKGKPIYKKVWKTEIYKGKKCVVNKKETVVKNTIWDGMGLVESSIMPEFTNGMMLLRNHFFKMCGFRSNIQLFFKDWCKKNKYDYETYIIYDMFNVPHYLKDIKVITTNNSIKWIKFKEFMGNTDLDAYKYWCDRINADGSEFGIVKTDHESKLGDVQQMSYQMINTLPCTKEDIKELSKTSVKYVELIKTNNDEFEKFLRKNANEINHYEMLADLYVHNKEFANSQWFRYEKRQIIRAYVDKLRKGKITINADNLTICGNPYALLLYAVGENFENDPTLNYEKGTNQCYTTRFKDGEYLCAFRNPHNSPNNVCFLHNTYSEEMKKYFKFSDNIIAVNCIKTDIQDRANSMDEDSDFFFVTNNEVASRCAKFCYENYPTIVNDLKESGIRYNNTKLAYAEMDNKFAKSRMSIGESSNLAQLAMTYYWTNPENQELYDNFIILSVLAQVAIDSCKREYEVDPINEIERIKKMKCMIITKIIEKDGEKKKIKYDLPKFMKYTKEIKYTKNGKEIPYEEVKDKKDKIKERINCDLVCPMNWLEDVLDGIQMSDNTNSLPTEDFFVKVNGTANNRQMNKIRELVEKYDLFVKKITKQNLDDLEFFKSITEETNNIIKEIKKVKIGNIVTINRLVEIALGLEKNRNKDINKTNNKYTRKILNLLYKSNSEKFLLNFLKSE